MPEIPYTFDTALWLSKFNLAMDVVDIDAVHQLALMIQKNPLSFLQEGFPLLLRILRKLLVQGIGMIKETIIWVFEEIKAIFRAFQTIVTTHLEIPLLTKLLAPHSKNGRVSMLDALSWILAIPAYYTHIVLHGFDPVPDTSTTDILTNANLKPNPSAKLNARTAEISDEQKDTGPGKITTINEISLKFQYSCGSCWIQNCTSS